MTPRPADAYHTLYCLSGLSAAQHHISPSTQRESELKAAWDQGESDSDSDGNTICSALLSNYDTDLGSVEDDRDPLRQAAFVSLLSWVEEEGTAKYVGGAQNRVVSDQSFNMTSLFSLRYSRMRHIPSQI